MELTAYLYPLKFYPIYKEKIWGGQKLKNFLKKEVGSLKKCGESWEISGVKDNISIVANGSLEGISLDQLMEHYKEDLLGTTIFEKYNKEFPLLIKFIDANDDLSIQVHPNDELAAKRHNTHGKTEMWYICEAEPKATLITGFNKQLSKEDYLTHFKNKDLQSILNVEEVNKGDVFFLPAGRIHNIGKGILLAEIQQTSDITYRIYDYERVDLNGKQRELHTEQAIDAIDYQFCENYKTLYPEKKNEPVKLVDCQYFVSNKLLLNKKHHCDYSNLDSFVIYICTEGEAEIVYKDITTSLKKGETLLIPATNKLIEIIPVSLEVELLETYIQI